MGQIIIAIIILSAFATGFIETLQHFKCSDAHIFHIVQVIRHVEINLIKLLLFKNIFFGVLLQFRSLFIFISIPFQTLKIHIILYYHGCLNGGCKSNNYLRYQKCCALLKPIIYECLLFNYGRDFRKINARISNDTFFYQHFEFDSISLFPLIYTLYILYAL